MKKYVILLFLLFFYINVSYSKDLSTIRSGIREKLKDNQSNTQQRRKSDTVLNRYINDAQRVITTETHCISSTTYTTTTSGTANYSLPSNFITEIRISYSTGTGATAYKRLEKMDFSRLDIDTPDWESTATGQPIQYYLSNRLIYLYPAPNATWAGTNRLKIDFSRFPADLSADTDIPYDGVTDLYPYHDLIIFYVLAQTFTELEDTNLVAYWEAKYSNLLGILFNNLIFKPDWQPSSYKK